MGRAFTIAGLAALALLTAGCATSPPTRSVGAIRAQFEAASGDVLVVAHRGCWHEAPENSLDAIAACARLGVDMVEIDVRETADGQLVLLHDASLERMTDGAGRLSQTSLARFRTLRLREGRGGPGARLTSLNPPTLREALRAAKGKVMLNLDAKQDLHDRIFAEVADEGMNDQILMKMRAAPDDPALVNAAFHGRALFMPVIFQCPLVPAPASNAPYCVGRLSDVVAGYDRYDPIAYEVIYTDRAFLTEGMETMAGRGRVWVNTLKPEFAAGDVDADALAHPDQVWGRLVSAGVNIIQTDEPAALLAYLASIDRHGSASSGDRPRSPTPQDIHGDRQ
ncbi:glycerophosphodiester phosphodiesterase family protein [Brevundimonas diminuta]|uniref:glycerophosphodiester phosphodiesterase family protein n=1 Tax=Brevundimonas TaxID=41275 RepID=UPI00198A6EB6|nr:glycerophosphodiester phosphodiesterase family protein [Brevundimonas diminuta]MBD3817428.1 glycerophosphodiester phosphodiesterase family protein [Brevundimonas diminuta]